MRIRLGPPGIRLGEDAYANDKDRSLGLSRIQDDGEFVDALQAAVAMFSITEREALEISDFRGREKLRKELFRPTLHPWTARMPGSTSDPIGPGSITSEGKITLDPGREAYTSKTKDDTRTDTQKFLDWMNCSKAEGGTLIPDSWARNACYARNAVFGIALVAGVVGILFVTRQLSPD